MALFQLCEHRDATAPIARECWTDLEGKEAALPAGRFRFAIAMPGVMDIGGTLSNTSLWPRARGKAWPAESAGLASELRGMWRRTVRHFPSERIDR
jgi:hypothetical protein